MMVDEITRLKNTIRFLEMDKEIYKMTIDKLNNDRGTFEINSEKKFDEIIKEELMKELE